MRRLTARQRRVLDVMTDTFELAYEIAHRAEIQARTAGPVLAGLEKRGLVERTVLKPAATTASDVVYGWRRL